MKYISQTKHTFNKKLLFLGTFLKKIKLRLNKEVVHLKPVGTKKGSVLISYTTVPFIYPKNVINGHTNRWECREIANLFLKKGYEVDVIDLENLTFIPKKHYSYFLDNGTNIERLFPLLKNTIKIYHATTCHWSFQNNAEMQRLQNLKERRSAILKPRRLCPKSHSVELADHITLLGNKMTKDTYAFLKKEIVSIPISTTHTFPSPEGKDFDKIRNNFVWVGGAGMVHKGLDLVIEAFKDMPDMHLSICGNVHSETDFENEYKKELYELPNIKVYGKIDIGGETFQKIIDSSIAIIYPSCSEGGGGSVITCMHAGLIPIVTYESSVNIDDFGILIQEATINKIKEIVKNTSLKSVDELRERATKAWKYARTHHTRELFSEAYRNFIESLEKGNKI